MKPRPDILVILSDQQRADSLGCFGQPMPVSPVLDRLAAEGVRYERAFTVQPVCGPARACLQTGLYATRTGNYRNDVPLPADVPTLPKLLSAVGYRSAYFGKWHLASRSPGEIYHDRPVPRERRGGYDDWLAADALEMSSHGLGGHVFDGDGRRVDFSGHRIDFLADWVLAYMEERDPDQPSLVFLSFLEPHQQNDTRRCEPPPDLAGRFEGGRMPGDLEALPGNQGGMYGDYLACCAGIDRACGRILDRLRETGRLENTLVVYASDHGCHFQTRNRHLPGGAGCYKRSCHEASIRIPLILRGPGFRGGRTATAPATLLDLLPTLLRAAGAEDALPPGYRLDGRPLQDLPEAPETHRDVFVQISEVQAARAIRRGPYTYCVRGYGVDGGRESRSDVYTEDYLYDRTDDPHELRNRVADPALADLRADLRQRLLEKIRDVEGQTPRILPADPLDPRRAP